MKKKKPISKELVIFIVSLMGVALLSSIITYAIMNNKYNKKIKELNSQIEELNSFTDEELGIESEVETISDEEYKDRLKTSVGVKYEMYGDAVDADDTFRKEASNQLREIVNYLGENNAYIALQVSDELYDTYIYNKQDEMFVEHGLYGTHTIGTKDGAKYRLHDSHWSESSDLDILSLLNIIADNIENSSTKVYKIDTSEYDVKSYEGSVVFDGWQEIYDFYSVVSDEYAENLLKQMMVGTTHNISMEFSFGFDANKGISIGSYVIMENNADETNSDDTETSTKDEEASDKAEKDSNTIYTNWSLSGYEILDDWSLDEEWYTVFKSDKEVDYTELLNKTYEDLSKILGVEEAITSDGETVPLDAVNTEDNNVDASEEQSE